MAATTTLLDLVTPTQGTLSGTWGDTVNYGISDYLDIAIAGTLSFAGDGPITLTNTIGSASGNNIGATTGQYMVIRVTGTLTTPKIITAPSRSKLYMVDNAATGSTVSFIRAGQVTAVSVAVGEKAFVYYNGTDYVKVSSSTADGVTTIDFGTTGLTPATATSGAVTVAGTLAVANGGTGITSFGTGVATFLGTPSSANLAAALTDETGSGSAVFATSPTLVTPILGTPTSATLTNATGLPISTGVSGLGTGVATALAVNVGSAGAPVVNGGALGTPSSGTLTSATGLPLTTGVTGTLPVGNGGTGATTLTANNVILGNGTSAPLFVAPSTAGNVLTSNGTTWASTTPAAGASGANPTATISGTAVNGVATTFMRSDAAPALANTAVTPASYTNASITVDAQGRITAASSGAGVAAATPTTLGTVYGKTSQSLTMTYLGVYAGASRPTTGNNTIIGYEAGTSNTTGDDNVYVGLYAGYYATTGIQNTVLGSNTGTVTLTTGSNNTVLGYNAAASSATVSNEATIGNSSVTSFRIPGLSVTWGVDTVPYRNIPQSGSAKTSSYTLVAGDVGEFIVLGTSGTVVIPASVFAVGDAVSIFNNTSGTIACTCSAITTVYKGGTDTNISSTGFSITTRGVVTILFVTTTTVVITGNLA